jgi:hypothetical protein
MLFCILYYSRYFKLIWGIVPAELVRILRCLQYRTVAKLTYFCLPTPGTFLEFSFLFPYLSLQAPPGRMSFVVKLAPSGQYTQGSKAVHELRNFRGSTVLIYATKHFLFVSVTAIGGSGWTGCTGTAGCYRSKGRTLRSARSKGPTLLWCWGKRTDRSAVSTTALKGVY